MSLVVKRGGVVIAEDSLTGVGLLIGALSTELNGYVEVVQLIGVANPVVFDRLARHLTEGFKVAREHASEAEAMLFRYQHAATMVGRATLIVVLTTATHRYTLTWPPVAWNPVSVEQFGVSTETSYSIEGGLPVLTTKVLVGAIALLPRMGGLNAVQRSSSRCGGLSAFTKARKRAGGMNAN